jgi:hypothetical protein
VGELSIHETFSANRVQETIKLPACGIGTEAEFTGRDPTPVQQEQCDGASRAAVRHGPLPRGHAAYGEDDISPPPDSNLLDTAHSECGSRELQAIEQSTEGTRLNQDAGCNAAEVTSSSPLQPEIEQRRPEVVRLRKIPIVQQHGCIRQECAQRLYCRTHRTELGGGKPRKKEMKP